MTPIDATTAGWMMLAGRILIGMIYLVSGIHKAIWYQKAVDEFNAGGAPFVAVTLPCTIALHIAGSICLVLGLYTQLVALALAVFTLLATLMVHGFWRFEGEDRLIRSRIFTGNLGIIGGLLYIAVLGPGPTVMG